MSTIFIVTPSATQRDLLAGWLRDDHAVQTVPDAARALALSARTEPDLIFLALTASEADDVAAQCQLTAQARRQEIPVIGLTDAATPGAEAVARAAGCVGVLETPPEAERLHAILRTWLGGG